jgi:hypothetical protein
MNKELINQLVQQVGTDTSGKWINTDRMDQFAELIVKECVRYFNEDYQRDFDTLWREDLTKGMKEHFGVIK